MSRVGSRGDDGHSLLEIVAVLAAFALLASLAVGTLRAGRAGADTQSAVLRFADTLRKARASAMHSTAPTRVSLDVDLKLYILSSTRSDGDRTSDQILKLPENTEVTIKTALHQVVAKGRSEIRFFPDGTSTGAHVTLTRDAQTWAVDVDWLTGRVTTVRQERTP